MNIIEEHATLYKYFYEKFRRERIYKVLYLRMLDELHWKMRSQILTPHI